MSSSTCPLCFVRRVEGLGLSREALRLLCEVAEALAAKAKQSP